MLDELAQLDPAAAADYARTILSAADSPDEWALALRNLALGDTSTDARALLENQNDPARKTPPGSKASPSATWKPSTRRFFSVAMDLLSPLSNLVRMQDNQAVAYAAAHDFDRLRSTIPARCCKRSNKTPTGWPDARKRARIILRARTSLIPRNGRSWKIICLTRRGRGRIRQAFLCGSFSERQFHALPKSAHAARHVGAALQQRDQVSLQVVNQWLADPRFQKNPAGAAKAPDAVAGICEPGRLIQN